MGHKCQSEFEKPMRHRIYRKGYTQNPGACACECDKNWEIGEYLKDW